MTLTQIRTWIWEGLGKATDLDPSSYTTLNDVVNEAQRELATWKDPRSGRRVRFRNLYGELYFKAKVISGTTAPSGTVSHSRGIKLSSSYVSGNSAQYNGWVISCGADRRLLVSYSGSGYSATIHTSWGTNPSNSAAYKLYKSFFYFLSSGDAWIADHITLPSTSGKTWRPTGNFLDVLRVEDLEDGEKLTQTGMGESWVANFDSPGDPTTWRRSGMKLELDCPVAEERWYRLHYYRLPSAISSDSDIPEIPEMFHYGLVLWGLWWGYRRRMESSSAYSTKRDLEDFMSSTIASYEMDGEYEETGGRIRPDDYLYIGKGR